MGYAILKNISIVGVLLGMTTMVSAQVMQSTSYRIQDDSINVGGGFATSASYRLEDTAGEVGTGEGTSTSYTLRAGYQQMHEAPYLALSSAADVTMSPSLGGVTGGESNGSTVLTATTDSYAGYQMTITASTSPAMQSLSDAISDYVPVGAVPDFTFTTDAGEAHLAFSPEGTDIASRYKDDGGACNIGSGDTTLRCWEGLSTTPMVIASRSSANHPSGTATTIRFKVGLSPTAAQPNGIYTATTTVTLISL